MSYGHCFTDSKIGHRFFHWLLMSRNYYFLQGCCYNTVQFMPSYMMQSRNLPAPTHSPRDDMANGIDQKQLLAELQARLHLWKTVSVFSSGADHYPYPENLSGDICYPVFLQSIPFCVLHKVCDGACSTKLHNKLQNKYQHITNIKHSSQLSSEAK